MKKIAIVPYDSGKLQDRLFYINTEDRCCENRENVFRSIYDRWNNESMECHTFDFYSDLSEVDVVVFYAFEEEVILKCLRHKCIKIYVMLEPETVVPVNGREFQNRLLDCFDYILSYNELFDSDRIIKSMMPYSFCNVVSEEYKREGIVLISSNKKSRENASAYDERIRLIDFLNENEGCFRLYGSGWDSSIKAYKGLCKDKLLVAEKSRFMICMENTTSVPGYITEKIFDAFASGCIPIYFGTDSIKKYLNPNAYICLSDFSTYDELIKCLKNLSDEEYNSYIDAGRKIIEEFKGSEFETTEHVKRLEKLFDGRIYADRKIKTVIWLWKRRFLKLVRRITDRIC